MKLFPILPYRKFLSAVALALLVTACGDDDNSRPVQRVTPPRPPTPVPSLVPAPPLPRPSPVVIPSPVAISRVVAPCSQICEDYAGRNRLQEALWLSLEEGNPGRAEQFRNELDRTLNRGNYRIEMRRVGGVTDKAILVFDNGVEALFKPEGDLTDDLRAANAHSEVAASELDQLWDLRIVPMTVLRRVVLNGARVTGSAHYFFQDGVSTPPAPQPPYRPANLPQTPDFATMQVFDFITGNSDRYNGGNWLNWDNYNRVIALDHAFAFRQFFGGQVTPNQRLEIAGSIVPDPSPDPTFPGGHVFQPGVPYNFQNLPHRVRNNLMNSSGQAVRDRLQILQLENQFVDRMIVRLGSVQRMIRNEFPGVLQWN